METEIKLCNVARASLQELLLDYEDYLRLRGLEQWPIDSPKAMKTRQICYERNDSSFYRAAIKVRSDETICNIAITLIHQCDYLLSRYINQLQKDFLVEGGIKEQMSNARRKFRGF